jgi:hypothetical protein
MRRRPKDSEASQTKHPAIRIVHDDAVAQLQKPVLAGMVTGLDKPFLGMVEGVGKSAAAEMLKGFQNPVVAEMFEGVGKSAAAEMLKGFQNPVVAGIFEGLGKSALAGMPTGLDKPVLAGWAQQVHESIAPVWIKQFQATLDHGPLTPEVLDEFQSSLLDGLAPGLHEVAEKFARTTDVARLEQIGDAPSSDFDPFLEAYFGYLARVGDWAQNRLPELSDRAAEGANRLAAGMTQVLFAYLLGELMQLGPLGFALGLLLGGQVQAMSDKEKSRLGPKNRQAVDFPCPTCRVVAGIPCRTYRGADPNKRAKTPHKGRLDAAGF